MYSPALYQRNRVKYLARIKVNYLVATGRLPRAADLRCVDCGGQARDYDHHRGYEGDAATDVQAVCKPCHVKRGPLRGENRWGSVTTRLTRIRNLMRKRWWLENAVAVYIPEPPDYSALAVRELDSSMAQLDDAEAIEMAHAAWADAVSLAANERVA